MNYFCLSTILMWVFFGFPSMVSATINLELTQGLTGALPIAVIPFKGQQKALASQGVDIAAVIHQDLHNSGHFRVLATSDLSHFPHQPWEIKPNDWHKKDIDTLVIGYVKPIDSGHFDVFAALVDVYPSNAVAATDRKTILFQHHYTVKPNEMRRLAHHLSDIIYKKLTGTPGIFSTHLAYVLVQRQANGHQQYRLEMTDFDGLNAQPLLLSREPIMSPSWSPDGRKIAYVSFEGHRSTVFIQDIHSGQRHQVAAFSGVNGAPSWSPDGQSLALVLTQTGTSKIYRLDLKTHRLTQLTQGLSIDTEPVWSPNGRSLIFTSNRGGSPQIYRLDLEQGRVTRLTFDGHYNVHASFAANGQLITLLHKEDHLFSIASLNLKSGILTPLTREGLYDSPSLSPNGSLIVYAASEAGRQVLNMVSIDGNIHIRLPAQQGDVQSPAWSPS